MALLLYAFYYDQLTPELPSPTKPATKKSGEASSMSMSSSGEARFRDTEVASWSDADSCGDGVVASDAGVCIIGNCYWVCRCVTQEKTVGADVAVVEEREGDVAW